MSDTVCLRRYRVLDRCGEYGQRVTFGEQSPAGSVLEPAFGQPWCRGREGPLARAPLGEGDPSRVGRYRLTARLGAGGMGVVYLGVAADGSQVAVKVLRPELADDQEFRARFCREVATLVRVAGLCTVRVIEADTSAVRPFMVTEYADGPSLADEGRTGRWTASCCMVWRPGWRRR